MSQIRDVVFDFCGVLINWQCRAALEGRFAQDIVDEICDEQDSRGFFQYEDDMDGGELLQDVLVRVRNEHDEETARLFEFYINHYVDALPCLIPGAQRLLEDLVHCGIRVWGLTNWSSETFPVAFERFPQLEQLLSGTIVSGIEHKRKPHADIYELAMNRFHLDPQSTVFFDDTKKNVDGALAMGWHAFVFTSAQQARIDLESLGVHIVRQ